MHRRSATAAAVLVALFPFVARAADDGGPIDDDDGAPMIVVEPAEPLPVPEPILVAPAGGPRPRAPRWVDASYASETLLLDGAAVTMFVPGIAADLTPLPGLGLLTYWLGPPIVHLSHGHVGKAFADLGIRTVAPFLFVMPGLVVAAAATADAGPEARREAFDVGGYAGLALGAAFAMAVDALVLTRERIPEERAYMRDDARLRLSPSGVAGRF